jgi:MinD superfamily P-loop ATPase
LCAGFGSCIDRCQMQAIKLVNEVFSVNKKKYIGCGNSVITFPESAIQLREKERVIDLSTLQAKALFGFYNAPWVYANL